MRNMLTETGLCSEDMFRKRTASGNAIETEPENYNTKYKDISQDHVLNPSYILRGIRVCMYACMLA